MAENTKIEWAHHTFNPWMGCQKVSPACDHCYAEVNTAVRALGVQWGPGAERRRTSAANWHQPLKWNLQAARLGIRYRVFCASLADVFDNAVPDQWRTDLFELIRITPNLDWLLLTKRPQNIVRMVHASGAIAGNGARFLPDNVWLGTTAEDQDRADQNIPVLLRTRSELGARVLFVSMEPLLGPVDLRYLQPGDPPTEINALAGTHGVLRPHGGECSRVDWIIVGGESGHQARPMHPDWVRSLRDQCQAAGVPFMFKQWGEFLPASANEFDPTIADVHESRLFWSDGSKWDRFDGQRAGVDLVARVGKKAAGRLLDGRTWDEVPA